MNKFQRLLSKLHHLVPRLPPIEIDDSGGRSLQAVRCQAGAWERAFVGWRSSRSLNFQGGFTLIEVMVVLLIMAIMAGLAVLSVQGHIDHARWTRSFEQIEELDRTARISARRDAFPYQLTFNKSKRKVELRPIGVSTSAKSVREFKLPASIQFVSFQRNTTKSSSDRFDIEFAPSGQSPSYAIALAASSGPPQWLVTLGFSGQQLRMENANDVAAMFPR